jgi:hypothetical protein
MGIDMSNYKMIYEDQVFNVISIMPIFELLPETGLAKPKFIEATYINENGEIAVIRDEAWTFKFVRR